MTVQAGTSMLQSSTAVADYHRDVEIGHLSTPETTYLRNFPVAITIDDLLVELSRVTGSSAAVMKVYRIDKHCTGSEFKMNLNGIPQPLIGFDSKIHTLEIYDPDPDSVPNMMANTTVEKFELTEAEYAQRSGTVRKFLEQKRLQMREEQMRKKKVVKTGEENDIEETDPVIDMAWLNQRCETLQGGSRGVIAFIGNRPMQGDTKTWLGVILDEPLGGNTCGEGLFDPPSKGRGLFVLADGIRVGDYPERDAFESEDEM